MVRADFLVTFGLGLAGAGLARLFYSKVVLHAGFLHFGVSPLHMAAIQGKAEVAAQLLAAGHDVDKLSYRGLTPLHFAAWMGRTDVIQVLLSQEAKVNALDPHRRTPLHYAAEWGHTEAVNLLIAAGAQVDAVAYSGLGLLMHAAASIHDARPVGHTPLHLAAWSCRAQTVRTLCEAGANVNAADSASNTPCHTAASHEGGDLPSDIKHGHILLQNEHAQLGEAPDPHKTFRELRQRGADMLARNRRGRTPWQAAWKAKNAIALFELGGGQGLAP